MIRSFYDLVSGVITDFRFLNHDLIKKYLIDRNNLVKRVNNDYFSLVLENNVYFWIMNNISV